MNLDMSKEERAVFNAAHRKELGYDPAPDDTDLNMYYLDEVMRMFRAGTNVELYAFASLDATEFARVTHNSNRE